VFKEYTRVAAATPKIRVGDCDYNAHEILKLIKKAAKQNIEILCLPELCLTGYTSGDLFLQNKILEKTLENLKFIEKESEKYDILTILGLPLRYNNKLFNVSAVISNGRVLGFVPKTYLPNYNEFNEVRYFFGAEKTVKNINFYEKNILFGTKLIFESHQKQALKLAVEICEDLWVPFPPSSFHATAGATIIANLSASDETTGKSDFRRKLVSSHSSRLMCGYVYSCSACGCISKQNFGSPRIS
jgi:NAD+ synthase (glutamine-hydrolysing)